MEIKKIKIRKTKIKSRSDEHARAIINVLKKAKKIKGKAKKMEEVLFNKMMKERQSMKKAHAYKNWANFVAKTLEEQSA